MAGTPTQQDAGIFPREYKEQLPPTLNVLTILTFIYSAFAFVMAFFAFAIAPYSYRNAVQNQGAMDRLPDIVRNLVGSNQVEAARLQMVYRTPILLITLAGMVCCFLGALWMRQLKKRGFTLYIIGDVLPIVNLVFFTSISALAGISIAFFWGIAILFVILYATQFKHMK